MDKRSYKQVVEGMKSDLLIQEHISVNENSFFDDEEQLECNSIFFSNRSWNVFPNSV